MKIDAVILAAGKSSRMKRNKLLLLVEGETVIKKVVKEVSRSQVNNIVVVTGRDAKDVEEELDDFDVDCVYNSNFEQGQSTSVKRGLTSLKNTSGGVLFFMGDQPLIKSSIINQMISAFEQSTSSILVPKSKEGRGNPVLFSRQWYDRLMDVSGDKGGRQILKEHEEEILYFDIEEPMFFFDVDDEDKYNELKQYLESQ